MRNLPTVVALAGCVLLGPVPLANAQSPCDTYSGGCHTPGPEVSQLPQVRGVKRTLPFTGGEIALLTLAGGGVLGAGAVFVTAGRRRARTPH